MQETPNLTDEMIVGRRPDSHGHLPEDMPRWMSTTIVAIDTFSLWVGRTVAWLTVPLMLGIVYEVFARYLFTAPTVWAYDISRMLYGATFTLELPMGLPIIGVNAKPGTNGARLDA
jgi:hypothetical protein